MSAPSVIQSRKWTSLVASFNDTLRDVPLGGTADTLALLSIGGGLLMATPPVTRFFAEIPVIPAGPVDVSFVGLAALAAAGFTAAGFSWLAQIYLAPASNRHVLRSHIGFTSSPPPMVPGSKPGLFFGLTTDKGEAVVVDDETLTRHCLTIGQSGVGKTVAANVQMFQQIERGGGLLFIDPKVDYDNIQSIYNYAVWCGRQDDVYILNPGDPENSNTYNPILFGDPDEVASRILGLIPSTEGNAGADYYKQGANSAIRAIVAAYQFLGIPYTMADIALLLDSVPAMDKLYTKVLAKDPLADEAIELRLWLESFRRPFDPKAQAGVGSLDMVKLKQLLAGIIGRLQQFGAGTFGKITGTYEPEVDLYDIITKGKICYVALPTMGKDVAAIAFAKMMIADMRTCVSWLQKDPAKRPKKPFMVFIDEAGQVMGSGEALRILFEQARSARIFLHLAVQNLAQFKAVAEEMAEMVPGNTSVKLIFRLGSIDSPNELAELIGMTKKVTRSLSKTAAKSTSTEFTQLGPGAMESTSVNTAYGEREQEEFLVHPDLIRRLDKGECIMLYEGAFVYDLRVPMFQLDREFTKKLGRFRIQHPGGRRKREGLFDLKRDVAIFTTNAPLVAGPSGGGSAGPANPEGAFARAKTRAKKNEGYSDDISRE